MNSVLFGTILVLFFAFVVAENDTTTVKIVTEDGATVVNVIENTSPTAQGIVEFISTVKATEAYSNATEKVTIDAAAKEIIENATSDVQKIVNETETYLNQTKKVTIDKAEGVAKEIIENITSEVEKIADKIPSTVNETEEYLNKTKQATADAAKAAKEIFKNATSSVQEVVDKIPTVNETKTFLNKTKQATIDTVNTAKEIFKNATSKVESKIKGIADYIPSYFNKTKKVTFQEDDLVFNKSNTRVVSPETDGSDAVVKFTVINWYEKAPIYFSVEYKFAGNDTETKSGIISNGTSATAEIPAGSLAPFFRVWYVKAGQRQAAFGHHVNVLEPRSKNCLEVCNYDLSYAIGVPTVEFCSETACGKNNSTGIVSRVKEFVREKIKGDYEPTNE